LNATNPIYFSDNRETLYWIFDKTPSAELRDMDQEIRQQLQHQSPAHDIIIVLINDAWANLDVLKYYPSAQRMYKDYDGAIYLIHNTPLN
jgi:hypothetical protein